MAAISFQLPADMRKYIAENSCMVLSSFNPKQPEEAEAMRKNIMFATSGSNTFKCMATTSDYGEDINLCPKGAKELLNIDSWEITFSTTAVTVNKDTVLTATGAAKSTGVAPEIEEIEPTYDIAPESFKDIWLVWAYGAGGFIAINMMNVFSTGGLSIADEDNKKGKFAMELRAFPTIDAPKTVPCKIYMKQSASLPASEVKMKKETV